MGVKVSNKTKETRSCRSRKSYKTWQDAKGKCSNRKSDFENREEAHDIYFQAKQGIVKGDCYF